MTSHTHRFIVLSTQRTGSSWLIDLLHKVENTQVYGELFLPQPRKWEVGSTDYPRFIEAKALATTVRPFSVFAYLDRLYAQPGLVGFKVMYSQLKSFPELLPYFMWKRTHIVHLIRRNHLDVVISTEMAKAQGLWHAVGKGETASLPTSGQGKRSRPQVTLNPGTLLNRLRWLKQKNSVMQKFVAWSGLPSLEIAYEDLLVTPATFSKLCTFLGIHGQEEIPRSTLSKIRQSSYQETIENYLEVERVLIDSEFADLLSVPTKPSRFAVHEVALAK